MRSEVVRLMHKSQVVKGRRHIEPIADVADELNAVEIAGEDFKDFYLTVLTYFAWHLTVAKHSWRAAGISLSGFVA